MTQRLSANDVFELSKAFHKLSSTLGDYRFDHWEDLTPKQRRNLEDKQWTLFNTASDLNSQSVLKKIKLLEEDLKTLKSATKKMQAVTKKITDIKHAIRIATKAIALGAAVYIAASTGNAGLIVSTASSLINEIDA